MFVCLLWVLLKKISGQCMIQHLQCIRTLSFVHGKRWCLTTTLPSVHSASVRVSSITFARASNEYTQLFLLIPTTTYTQLCMVCILQNCSHTLTSASFSFSSALPFSSRTPSNQDGKKILPRILLVFVSYNNGFRIENHFHLNPQNVKKKKKNKINDQFDFGHQLF